MSQYGVVRDLARVSEVDLSRKDVDVYLGYLVGPDAIANSLKEAVKPFSADLPPAK